MCSHFIINLLSRAGPGRVLWGMAQLPRTRTSSIFLWNWSFFPPLILTSCKSRVLHVNKIGFECCESIYKAKFTGIYYHYNHSILTITYKIITNIIQTTKTHQYNHVFIPLVWLSFNFLLPSNEICGQYWIFCFVLLCIIYWFPFIITYYNYHTNLMIKIRVITHIIKPW